MMPARLIPVLVLLLACGEAPTAPAIRLVTSAETERISAIANAAPSLILTAPAQIVIAASLRADERLWFEARLIVGGQGSAQMDGAILVVSAADGPMPKPQDGWTRIAVHLTELGTDGGIRFEGLATVHEQTALRTTLPVTGTAEPHASDPDFTIWEIRIGEAGYVFAARSRIAVVADD